MTPARSIAVVTLALALGLAGGCGGKKSRGPTLQAKVDAMQKEANPKQRARGLAKLGHEQFQAGDLSAAAVTLALAAKACEDIKQAASRAAAYTYLARAQALAGDRSAAAQTLLKARAAVDSLSEIEERARGLAEIGGAQAKELKDSPASQNTLQESARLADEIPDAVGQAETLVAIAQSYLRGGLQPDAERILHHALETAQSIADPQARAAALVKVAAAQDPLLATGAPRAAFDKALLAAREINDDYKRAFTLANIAEQLINAGRVGEARSVLDEARPLSERIKAVDLQKDAADRLHEVEIQLKPQR